MGKKAFDHIRIWQILKTIQYDAILEISDWEIELDHWMISLQRSFVHPFYKAF